MISRILAASLLVCVALPVHAQNAVVDGRFGPGALYRLVRPANWNRTLVVYAHGFVSPDVPVALPTEADDVIAALTYQGFAVAYSSYSENGWAVKDGAQRTHQLLGLFTSTFGRPSRVYLGGGSMGSLIVIKLLEEFPKEFAGAVAACPAAGGTRAQFEYGANVRAIFDVLYPNLLPGSAAGLPPGTTLQDIVAPAALAMSVNPAFTALGVIDQTPIPWATGDFGELAQSIVFALATSAGSTDLLERTKGHPYFENRTTIYSSSGVPLPALNAAVERFAASPSALNFMAHDYEPTGDLRVPMLMIANARDPVVPAFHRQMYAQKVAAMGRATLLFQREITSPPYGHCLIHPADLAAAFLDLVLWVEYGVHPH